MLSVSSIFKHILDVMFLHLVAAGHLCVVAACSLWHVTQICSY